jgi:serine/threonine protein kinase
MAYTEHTHCPNCFKPSFKSVCTDCFFDREIYLKQEAASHHLPLFSSLDKGYTLGRVIGEGSFAIVYAAIREKDQLLCAVKEYYPHDLAQRGLDGKSVNPKRNQEQLNIWQNRFIQEGELLRCCYDYPSVESGVVRYMAMVKQHGTAYLVMERLNGDNLAHYLTAHRTLSGETICLWLKPLLETLQKLHAKEIYHRDISPNNIFLCSMNNPVLMDFGLAREGARDEVLKSSTLGAGTFIAPEQLTGGYCDQRTDLYALGAVIYLCLHGEAPPPVEARRQGAPLKRLNLPDAVSLALQNVATHCLQLDLQMRPKNAGQLLAELAHCWVNPFSVSPSPLSKPMRTIIPDLAQSNPSAEPQVLPNPATGENEPQVPAKPPSRFFIKTLKLMTWAGLAYVGFTAYQNYTEEQEKLSKQERQLFAKAKTLDDFKTYLEKCVICEAKQDASDKITKLEQDRQRKEARQKLKKQEHAAYIKAQTVDELRAYLASCELCLDKDKAEAEIAKLEAAQKPKYDKDANPLETMKTIVDSAKQVYDEVKAPIDELGKSEAEIQAEERAKATAESNNQSQNKLKADLEEALRKAQMEQEAQAKAQSEADARAKAKAEAEAKLKAEVENAIKEKTGEDVKQVQDWLDSHTK